MQKRSVVVPFISRSHLACQVGVVNHALLRCIGHVTRLLGIGHKEDRLLLPILDLMVVKLAATADVLGSH